MTKEELKIILKDKPKDVQRRAVILVKAELSAAKAYQDKTTSANLKDWKTAEAARDEFLAELEDGPGQDVEFSGGKVIVGPEYLAHLFGITSRAVRKWPDMGCPKLGRGQYDLKEVFDWWWSNLAKDRAEAEATDDSINEAKRLYWWEKARGEETKNKREKEQLIPREAIAAEWAARVSEVANGLQALSMRLPPLISGKESKEVRDIVKLNVRQILENYSRTGRFCQKVRVSRESVSVKTKRRGTNGTKSKTR